MHPITQKLLDAVSENGYSYPDSVGYVRDFRHVSLAITASSSPTLTVRILGSVAEEMPDFSSAASETNQWKYVQTKNLEDGSTIDGDTGVNFAGTAGTENVEVNTNNLRWLAVEVSGHSAGTVTVVMAASPNQ